MKPQPDPLALLEEARESFEAGAPSRSLALLPGSRVLPRLLRPERDLLEAEALRAMGFFRRAEALYGRLLRSAGKGDPAFRIEAALGSAAGLRSVGHVALAAQRLSAARAEARRAGLRGYAGRLSLEETLVDRAAGRYGIAIRRLKPAVRAALAARDWGGAAYLLWAVGGAERFRGNLKDSQAAFERSRRLARRAGDAVGEGYALFGLGGVTRILGRLRDSERWYARAGKAFQGTDDLFARAYAACGRANALRQLGRLGEAERLYRRSRKLYASLEDEADLGYVDWGLGEIHFRRGDLTRALPRFALAARAFRRHGEARGLSLALLSMARVRHSQGRTAMGETLFRQACALARKAGLHTYLESFT